MIRYMKVSIIVPVFNADKYLDKCLNSLTNQTYKDIEIILINDGSTDKSEKIINEYKKIDNRIKVIEQKSRVYDLKIEWNKKCKWRILYVC